MENVSVATTPPFTMPPLATLPPPVNNDDIVAKGANPEMFASLSILLQIILLGAAFVCGHILRRKRILVMHEAGCALLMGVLVGLMSRIFNTEERFRTWLNFKEEFFFLFLLPPIIFESGFSLHPKAFFANFGAICMFAFVGTLVAAVTTGVILFVVGFLYLSYSLPFVESLMFGALISATDPVTVLAIFQELGVDVNLYALVFGESVLNDAVAIVLYRTLLSFQKDPYGEHSIYDAMLYFLVILAGSLAIGTVVSLACALLFKYAGLAVHNLHNLESCLVVLFPYMAYMMAEGLSLSGIVAILFTGVLMKHYALPNLSEKSQETVISFFHMLATMAETFVFIYMGVAIFNSDQSWKHFTFTLWAIVAILVSRACNIFPIAYLINLVRLPSRRIPHSHQKALWFSGLRGAMAFALAMQSVDDLPHGHGKVLYTTTVAIVCLTVLGVGGSTPGMLGKLDLLEDTFQRLPGGSFDGIDEERNNLVRQTDSEYSPPASPANSLQMRLQQFQRTAQQYLPDADGSFLVNMDKKYIRPFFTTTSDDESSREAGSKTPPRTRRSDGGAPPRGSTGDTPTQLEGRPPKPNRGSREGPKRSSAGGGDLNSHQGPGNPPPLS